MREVYRPGSESKTDAGDTSAGALQDEYDAIALAMDALPSHQMQVGT